MRFLEAGKYRIPEKDDQAFIREVRQTLIQNGFCLLPGGARDLDEFISLTRVLGAKRASHGGERRTIGDPSFGIQNVTSGSGLVEPHIEMGRSPHCPQLAFFYCQLPAVDGGETTLVDGYQALQLLPGLTRNYFESTALDFASNFHEDFWFRAAETKSISGVLDAFSASNHGSVSISHSTQNTFLCNLSTSALKVSPLSGLKCFANSILGPYRGSSLSLNGSPPDELILQNIRDIYQHVMVRLKLEQGDIVIIDNFRVMHGRMPFSGDASARRILACFTDARNDLLLPEG